MYRTALIFVAVLNLWVAPDKLVYAHEESTMHRYYDHKLCTMLNIRCKHHDAWKQEIEKKRVETYKELRKNRENMNPGGIERKNNEDRARKAIESQR